MTTPALKITPNTIRHSILAYLDKRESSTLADMHDTFRIWVPGMGEKVFKSGTLDLMRTAELIDFDTATNTWFITEEGRARLQDIERKVNKILPELSDIVRNNLFIPTGTYDGRDLKRNSTRPGAYIAYAIPSKTAWSKEPEDAPAQGQ